MSWYTDAQYRPVTAVCECSDGIHEIKISGIKEENFQGKRVLAVYLNVNDSAWNKIPYRYAIFEGDNFDYGFSRLCDCFAVNLDSVRNGNWQPFVNKTGRADFSHLKSKKVQNGFSPDGKPIESWVTEKSQYVNAKLLEFTAPQPAQSAQNAQNYSPAMSRADSDGLAKAFGTPATAPLY